MENLAAFSIWERVLKSVSSWAEKLGKLLRDNRERLLRSTRVTATAGFLVLMFLHWQQGKKRAMPYGRFAGFVVRTSFWAPPWYNSRGFCGIIFPPIVPIANGVLQISSLLWRIYENLLRKRSQRNHGRWEKVSHFSLLSSPKDDVISGKQDKEIIDVWSWPVYICAVLMRYVSCCYSPYDFRYHARRVVLVLATYTINCRHFSGAIVHMKNVRSER